MRLAVGLGFLSMTPCQQSDLGPWPPLPNSALFENSMLDLGLKIESELHGLAYGVTVCQGRFTGRNGLENFFSRALFQYISLKFAPKKIIGKMPKKFSR